MGLSEKLHVDNEVPAPFLVAPRILTKKLSFYGQKSRGFLPKENSEPRGRDAN